jgi:hypothetical protein
MLLNTPDMVTGMDPFPIYKLAINIKRSPPRRGGIILEVSLNESLNRYL